ncbi:oxidoreductase [Phyllosticta capitalensis]|uniref:short chain dehydrogenase/ reductase n=1 Tax=Phyllosticta capitalensis TaxID=121624 RepID=UPI003131BC63
MAPILEGVAFITSAGSGLGQTIAFSMAKHGVKKFALADTDEAGLQTTAAGLEKEYGVTDVLTIGMEATEESIESAVHKAAARFGRIDFAVNETGFGGPMGGSPDTSLADFNGYLSSSVAGVWLCHRAQIRQMLKQEPRGRYGRGSIVNMSSIHGLVASPAFIAAGAYVAGRHALLGLTKTEGALYAPQGVRINAICSGYYDSPLIHSSAQMEAVVNKIISENVPVDRLADPEEVADAAVFLASPMSSYMFGQGLVVDGGYTAK